MDVNMLIRNEFEAKKSKNKNYSLRALARDLDVSVSTLSESLNGKHKLSYKSLERILLKLEIDTETAIKLKLQNYPSRAEKALLLEADTDSFKRLKNEVKDFIKSLKEKYPDEHANTGLKLVKVLEKL